MRTKTPQAANEFDGCARCWCGCQVMIPAGKAPKKLRRKLALASHTQAIHSTLHFSKINEHAKKW